MTEVPTLGGPRCLPQLVLRVGFSTWHLEYKLSESLSKVGVECVCRFYPLHAAHIPFQEFSLRPHAPHEVVFMNVSRCPRQ